MGPSYSNGVTHWELDKKVPLPLILTVLGAGTLQLLACVWFISAMNGKIDVAGTRIAVVESKIIELEKMSSTIARMDEKIIAATNIITSIQQNLTTLTAAPPPPPPSPTRPIPISRPKVKTIAVGVSR